MEQSVSQTVLDSEGTWWFGIAKRVSYTNINDAIKGLQIDWEVGPTKKMLGFLDKDENPIDFFENQGIVRLDNRFPLGIMGNVYTVIQNREALEMFESILDSKEITIEGGGCIKGGKKLWVACRLPNDIQIGDERILRYIVISWSHNGESSLSACFVPYLASKQISLASYVPGIKSSVSIRHTTNYEQKIKQCSSTMKSAYIFFEKLEQMLQTLNSKTISINEFNQIMDLIYPNPEIPKINKHGELVLTPDQKRKERIKERFQSKKNPFGQTKLGAILADAEESDHSKTKNTRARDQYEAKIDSSLFGSSFNRKFKTVKTVLNFEEIIAQKKAIEKQKNKPDEKESGNIM